MMRTDFEIAGVDRRPLACTRWAISAAPRGIIQIAHGMGEHIGRYEQFARFLAERDLIVVGNDHRGHGRSALSSAQRGDFGAVGFEGMVGDMLSLGARARKEFPDLPLVLFGHSMWSFAVQALLIRHCRKVDAAILSGSGCLDLLATGLQASRMSAAAFLNHHIPNPRTEADWLTRSETDVDAFLEDPYCFPMLTDGSTHSILGHAPILADPSSLARIRPDLPIYMVSGSDDPVGQMGHGVALLTERYRRAGVSDVRLRLYVGGRHEMLHELNREEVFDDILSWVLHALDAGRSAAVP